MNINIRSGRADECASWIMYEGHCTRLLLAVVIRLGDKPIWLQCSSHTSSGFCVWRISASYMADIITSFSYYSVHPRTLKQNEMASLILLLAVSTITFTEWVIFCCCGCESKPLPVFLQSFGLLACLRVLIHQVKPWRDALMPSVMSQVSFHLYHREPFIWGSYTFINKDLILSF